MDPDKRERLMAKIRDYTTRKEAEAQKCARADNIGMVYKTIDDARAAPAPAPAPDSDDQMRFVLDVVAEALGELSARHDREIASLKDKLDAYTKMPADQARSTRDLVESTRELRAALADVQATLAEARTLNEQVTDLPALPRDLN